MNSVAKINPATSVVVRLGQRFGVDPEKLLGTLKATAFRGEVTTEQMMALLVVSEAHNLNPFLKEIYAFPARGGIVPVVSIDGWAKIMNEHPQFDGMKFTDGPEDEKGLPQWIECEVYRKDRAHPIAVKEYMSEVRRETDPWKSHPRRMLRHKTMIQAARLAFSFAGIFDEDEGERIREAIDVTPVSNINPRGEGIQTLEDFTMRDKHVEAIRTTVDELGSDEAALGAALKDYLQTSGLGQMQDLYIAVLDKMCADGLMTKGYWRKLVK
jgi:phage recombination protein Bet